ncbi:MAG TPA: hypothetical protein GYA08_09110 [Chloroflexi bacterium]|nr:hypothetical protein [Chloroflexota bacterium]
MDSVIVGSASSRTFPVNYAIMPEAMTYGRAEGSSNVIVTPEAMTYGRTEGSSNVCHAGGDDLRERPLRA